MNVVKQNDIVQKARYKLDLVQQKTIMYLISKIDSMKDVEFQEITVNLKDLCEIMGINECAGKNIKSLKDAIQKLADKSMWVDIGGGKITLMRWLTRATIDEGHSTVIVKFDELMAPYLLQIKDGCFTQYKLIDVLPMKSQYSLRLYELIKSQSGMGAWTVAIEEIRRLLYVDEVQTYKEWRDLKKRVIDPAILEICNFTDLAVAYSTKRTDRKISHIQFYMCDISEENYTEGARREINRNTVLDNMPAEVVPPRKMPTVATVKAMQEKRRKAAEAAELEKKYLRAKKPIDYSEPMLVMPTQQSIFDDL